MKHFLFSLLAIAALAACSKNDDNTSGDGGGNGGTTSTTVTSTTQTPTVKVERMISFGQNGKHTYEVIAHYENGKIRSTATFIDGDIDGVVKKYNQAGKVIKETLYKNGKKVK